MSVFDELPECYINLAIAVVQQVVDDYKGSYKRYLKRGVKSKRLLELEDWFENGEGHFYSLGKGLYIMKTVQEELNRKRIRGYDHNVEIQGRTQTLRQWAEEYGIPLSLLSLRLNYGWTYEEAITTPRGGRRERRQEKI